MNAPAELTMLDLSALAHEYMQAKAAETAATERRRALGERLCFAIPGAPHTEGVSKATLHDVRVSITYGLNRSVDSERLKTEWAALPADAQAAFRWKADVATPALRLLEGEALAAAQAYITTKPAAPAIKVEVL